MKRRFGVGLLLQSLLPATWVSAQVPAGGEFRVNTSTVGLQMHASVASSEGRGFFVAWGTPDSDGRYRDVAAQCFDAAGAPVGSEFQVNSFTTRYQLYPRVASDAAGNYIVTWQSEDQDGSSHDVFARRYDAGCAALGAEFRVNTHTTSAHLNPSVASDAVGNFVVVWRGNGVFGRMFDASGTPRGAELLIGIGAEYQLGVASDPSGGFVVVWQDYGEGDGSGSAIHGRRYDAAGTPRGPEFRVNTYTTDDQSWPSVASDPAGNFIVTWSTWDRWQVDSPSFASAQRFDAAGAAVGSEFRLGAHTTFDTDSAVATFDRAGNFVLSWSSREQDGHRRGVFARRYDASGAPRGSEFQVNTFTYGQQGDPELAADAAGNLLVTWTSEGLDGSANGVSGQRFGGLLPAALAVDPSASSGSDGNGVLEGGETAVEVRPAWRNVNGLAQTFDGVGLGFAGPAASGVGYELSDAAGAYGALANGMTATCSDCYQVGVTFAGTRPATHWDATFTERLTPDLLGQTKPWSVHVGDSFSDVPRSSPYYRFVETLLHRKLTGGCSATAYCPAAAVTREQMSVFVLAGKEGAAYLPVACTTPGFGDVAAASPFCRWIEELARRGVVGGCGGGNFCPTNVVTREQMSVFLLHTLDPALDPPACTTPVFADVPPSSPFCRWIEALVQRGITGGCGGGNYCPTDPVTREQMAAFIGATFGLSLYGP